jgi:hypothetical protein
MLQDFFIPKPWQLNLLDTNFFQQDGARFHYALNVRRLFNDVFTYKWIVKGGPIAWPGLSPNLTPLDYQYTILLLAKMSTYQLFYISNFRRVLYVVCFLLGDSPASEFYKPTFRNTLSVPSS